MGSSASPIVADIVMEELLERCIEICDIRPKFLTKYVDDLFGIIKISAINNFLTILNSYNHHIKFTIEKEKDNRLAYLDAEVIRKNGELKLNWYQKPSASGRILNFHSKHPNRIILNTATNFINRVLDISDEEFKFDNLIKIKNILRKNGFPAKTINRMLDKSKNKIQIRHERPSKCYKSVLYIPGLSERFLNSECIEDKNYAIAQKSTNTLRKLFTNIKPRINTMDISKLVYRIKCNGNDKDNCNKYYVGITKNKLRTRLTGHKSDIKHRSPNKTQKTALAAHCAQEQHQPDLDDVRILQCESNYNKRLTLEMLHILSTPTTQLINYKTDTENLAHNYRHLIRRKINQTQ